MQTLSSLPLRNAKPSDRPHLLLWDTPNEADLEQISFYNHAERINYRDNLLSRIDSKERFLVLHQHLDREVDAIRAICSKSSHKVVLLEGLDALVTYLYAQPSIRAALLWQKLSNLRHLESILWILLPNKLAPPNWTADRSFHIPTPLS